MMVLGRRVLIAGCLAVSAVWPNVAQPAKSEIVNVTGLPAYPNLTSGAMQKLLKTETFGRWCARFDAATSDSLSTVESWYRRALSQASETDLTKDDRYNSRPQMTGIKLALGIDYVVVYRAPNQETRIELHRCNWAH